MPGQPAHFEIPADDTAKGRQFWGALFDWQFEASPGPFEYYMTRISDQGRGDHQHGARQARHSHLLLRGRHQRRRRAREGARRRGERPGLGAGHGLVRDLQGPQGNEFGLWQNDPSAPAPTG